MLFFVQLQLLKELFYHQKIYHQTNENKSKTFFRKKGKKNQIELTLTEKSNLFFQQSEISVDKKGNYRAKKKSDKETFIVIQSSLCFFKKEREMNGNCVMSGMSNCVEFSIEEIIRMGFNDTILSCGLLNC